MRGFHSNPTPAVFADFSDGPDREVRPPSSIKWDPANRHDPRPPKPGLSLPFDGTVGRTARIVGWDAALGIVGASLDSAADGNVECVLWVRTTGGNGETVSHRKCLSRGTDGIFSVVADAQADAILAELARLCAGVDPFAPSAQAAPRPSTRDT